MISARAVGWSVAVVLAVAAASAAAWWATTANARYNAALLDYRRHATDVSRNPFDLPPMMAFETHKKMCTYQTDSARVNQEQADRLLPDLQATAAKADVLSKDVMARWYSTRATATIAAMQVSVSRPFWVSEVDMVAALQQYCLGQP